MLTVTAIALLAGIGSGAWFLVGRHNSSSDAQGQQAAQRLVPTAPQAGAGAAGGSSAVGAESGSPGASGAATGTVPASGQGAPPGPVAIAPAVAGNTLAPQVAAFLDKYFDAINAHGYQAYIALRSPQAQGITQAQFNAGYGSTTDSAEMLRGISSADDGDAIAQVTFTSQQSAAESPTNSTCTAWNISLFLVPNGDGYLIDNPPSDYHAGYSACA